MRKLGVLNWLEIIIAVATGVFILPPIVSVGLIAMPHFLMDQIEKNIEALFPILPLFIFYFLAFGIMPIGFLGSVLMAILIDPVQMEVNKTRGFFITAFLVAGLLVYILCLLAIPFEGLVTTEHMLQGKRMLFLLPVMIVAFRYALPRVSSPKASKKEA